LRLGRLAQESFEFHAMTARQSASDSSGQARPN
jgi:hypothetical protein